MKKFRTRFYYTLEDLFERVDIHQYPTNPSETFEDSLDAIGDAGVPNLPDAAELETLWKKYLYPTYNQSYIIYIDREHSPWEEPEEPDDEEIAKKIDIWLGYVSRWANETVERYVPLIRTYEDIKDKLLDKINTETLVLYNDTPQSAGDWTTDPYTTNATKTTNSQEIATPIERLDEIDNKLKSLYGEWADEFRMLVIIR